VSGTLSASTIVARKSGLIESEVDREIVALNIESGVCYGLNEVGSRIWSLLANPVPISEVCATLLSEFEVERDTCEREVIDLIEHLLEEGLVTATNPK
jgi:coenzyme PQQ synthesis protein D (PqqD)